MGKNFLKQVLWILPLLLWAVLFSKAFTLDSEANRATLKGLEGVRVLVEDIAPEVEKSGLSKGRLQSIIELKLKKTGIKVLTQEEVLRTPGEPYLYLNINAATGKTQPHLFMYSIDLALIQDIVLERDPRASTYGITWSTGAVGLIEGEALKQLSESILGMLDLFIEAYQSANKAKAKP